MGLYVRMRFCSLIAGISSSGGCFNSKQFRGKVGLSSCNHPCTGGQHCLVLSEVSLHVFLYVRTYFLGNLLVWLCSSEAMIFDVALTPVK